MSSGEYVDHLDGPIAWREAGTGQPIMFLHGLGGGRSAWGPQLRELSADARCIAWDMPGYGRSQPIEPLTFAAISDELVALLDRLGIASVDLVGLSFGGMHALHTAIRHPARVNRLVLADTSPAFGLDGTTVDEWQRARLAPLDAGQTPADMAEMVLDAITAHPLTGRVRNEIVGAFSEISSEGLRAAVECLPHHDVRNQLASIPHPTLVVVGELDDETPLAYAEALATGIPDAQLHVVPGVGHLTPSESPERFNEIVRSFLINAPNHQQVNQ